MQPDGCGRIRIHAIHGDHRHGVDRNRIILLQINTTTAGPGRHNGHGDVQRITRSTDACQRLETNGICCDLLVFVATINDRSAGGLHSDIAARSVQSAQGDTGRSHIQDIATTTLSQCTIGHGDRTIDRQEVDRAANRADITHNALVDYAVSEDRDITSRCLDTGIDQHILVIRGTGPCFQADITISIRHHGLVHRQRAIQSDQHHRTVAGQSPHFRQRSISLVQIDRHQARGIHPADRDGTDGVYDQGVVLGDEYTTRTSTRSQSPDHQIQVRRTAADRITCHQTRTSRDDLLVRVTTIRDRAGGRRHTHITRASFQTAKHHIDSRQITQRRARGLGDRAISHGDGAVLGLHIDGASRADITFGSLADAVIGQHSDASARGAHHCIQVDILVIAACGLRLEAHIAEAMGSHTEAIQRDTIIDRQRPIQSDQHHMTVTRSGHHIFQHRFIDRRGRGIGVHTGHTHRFDRIHHQGSLITDEDTATGRPGRQDRHQSIQMTATRADAHTRSDPQFIGLNIHQEITVIRHRTRSGSDADKSSQGRIQASQSHIRRRLITDISTSRCRRSAVTAIGIHRDGTVDRFHINRAGSTSEEVAGQGLGDAAVRYRTQIARRSRNRRIERQILVIAAGGLGRETDVTGRIHCYRLIDRQ